jgi:gas vesicle protein
MSEELQPSGKSDESASKLAWFITGAVIGATAALLYAPRAGKETRQSISEATHRGKEAVSDTGKDVIEAGRDMFERGRRLVEDAADLFERGRRLVRG